MVRVELQLQVEEDDEQPQTAEANEKPKNSDDNKEKEYKEFFKKIKLEKKFYLKKEVVVGDIVIINTGDEIPADGILIESVSLQVNESTLTGEPVANKYADPEKNDPRATYPSNMLLNGCTVMEGHGVMEVQQVGDATEYGKVYKGAQIENDIETPLNIQLNKLANLITKISYTIAALIIVIRCISFFSGDYATDWISIGQYILNTIMIARLNLFLNSELNMHLHCLLLLLILYLLHL